MLQVVLGIDVGTSGTKVVAVSDTGSVLATATSGYEMLVPERGWAEQNPEDWWQATVMAVKSVTQQLRQLHHDFQVLGIGFSGQMHGLVPLDAKGEVIRPSMIWCDLRSAPQAEWLTQTFGAQTFIQWTQNPPLPNFTLTKLLWMKQHEPELFAKIETILLPKDYVRYRMTGAFHMDAADASGTLLFDVAKRTWSEEVCNATGVPMRWLPTITESSDVVGRVTAEAARLFGVSEGVPVVAGAGDQAAGAVGLGVLNVGTVSVAFGTSGVVLTPTDQPLRDVHGRLHTFCHAVPGKWYVMGVTQTAGGALQWYRNRLAQGEHWVAESMNENVYTLLLAQASKVPAGADGLVFLPYLMGERTPHLNPAARGAFIGLDWRHGRGHMVRSILEGVSYSLRDCWQVIEEIGAKASDWRVSGGGADGELWMDIFASVVGRQIETIRGAQGPAFGGAVLAAHGAGILDLNATDSGKSDWWKPGTLVQPKQEWITTYDRHYTIYRKSYTALKEIYHDLQSV